MSGTGGAALNEISGNVMSGQVRTRTFRFLVITRGLPTCWNNNMLLRVHGGLALLPLIPPPHTSSPHSCRCSFLRPQTQSEDSSLRSCVFPTDGLLFTSDPTRRWFKRRRTLMRASRRAESPYEVLGVSPSATPDEIKRAYRKLALKFHPDVNKEANSQEKFMRIKHAYNTLLKSKDGRSGFSYYTSQRSGSSPPTTEDEFYGLGEFVRDIQMTLEDFFKDLQDEFRNWESSVSSQGKPKSLWEELAEVGEEFVEFLEKELNITDSESQAEQIYKWPESDGPGRDPARANPNQNKDGEGSSIEENIDEIEATLAQLKKQLGL